MSDQQNEFNGRTTLWSAVLRWLKWVFAIHDPKPIRVANPQRSLSPAHKARSDYSRIERTQTGIEVFHRDDLCWGLEWEEVVGVYTYKEDLICVDRICFALQVGERTDVLWCINEDLVGFKQIEPELTRLSENGWPDKFREIALPAFEFNWTKIWRAPHAPEIVKDPILLRWFPIPETLRRDLRLDSTE